MMQTTTKDKLSPTEILMQSLSSCEGATGVVIIVDKEGDGVYELRSNLTQHEICGLFEVAKFHVISNIEK